jgi:TonB family protein
MGCGTARFRSPKVISKIELDYPLTAQIQRMEGDVLVGVFVNKDGKPEETNLVESSGHPELDDAALAYVKKLDFQPACVDEKAIGAWTRLLMRYRLDKVYFEKEKWLNTVLELQSQIATEKDSIKLENDYRKYYTQLLALSEFARVDKNPEINRTIQHTLSKSVRDRWQPLWDSIAAPFTAFDDFLFRYPACSYSNRVTDDLLLLLVEAEHTVRASAIKSTHFALRSSGFIDLLDKRVTELKSTIKE